MEPVESISQFRNIIITFNAITEKIVEHTDNLDQLPQAILGLTVSMTNVTYAAILLLDEGQQRFETDAKYGEPPFGMDIKASLDISKLMDWQSRSLGETLLFKRLVDEGYWESLEDNEKRPFDKMLCSPLIVEQKIMGLVCVYGENLNRDMLEAEEFSLLAKLASLAIEKSRLYNRVHKSLDTAREELTRSQSQLIRSEKLSSLVEIAMSVAHVIRNPITVIGGLSRRMHDALPQNDAKREWSEMIVSEALRLENIVREFERFYSIDHISFQRMDINCLVAEAADDFCSQSLADADFDLSSLLWHDPLFCRVDEDLLKRSIIHLLSNAIEATGEDNRITLATFQEVNDAVIEVLDTGKGMSPRVKKHAFEPFYSTRDYGAGMGLTFVHFVTSEHGGKIELKSEKGKGSRFRIRLPLDMDRRDINLKNCNKPS